MRGLMVRDVCREGASGCQALIGGADDSSVHPYRAGGFPPFSGFACKAFSPRNEPKNRSRAACETNPIEPNENRVFGLESRVWVQLEMQTNPTRFVRAMGAR